MVKYKRQLEKKYEAKESAASVSYFDRMASVAFDNLTMHEAEQIGCELVNQLVCQSIATEWNGATYLWLEEFDYGLYGDGHSLPRLLEEIGSEYGVELTICDSAPT